VQAKTPLQYGRLKRFDILGIGEMKKVYLKRLNREVLFTSRGNLRCNRNCSFSYTTWRSIQTENGYCKEVRQCNNRNDKYFLIDVRNLPTDKTRKKKGLVTKPILHSAKADLRNIVGVVLDKNEDGLYKIGTKDGVVDKLYCR
jgi:hypothetical protein